MRLCTAKHHNRLVGAAARVLPFRRAAPAEAPRTGEGRPGGVRPLSGREAMKRFSCGALALLLAGCAGQAAIPHAGPMAVVPAPIEGPPVYSLLGEREELALSSAQVTQLDSIAEGVRAANRNVVLAARAGDGELRVESWEVQQLVARNAGLAARIRANNRAAAEAVRSVLGEEQQRRVCRMVEENRRERGEPLGGFSASASFRPGTVEVAPEDRVAWTWCGAGGARRA